MYKLEPFVTSRTDWEFSAEIFVNVLLWLIFIPYFKRDFKHFHSSTYAQYIFTNDLV